MIATDGSVICNPEDDVGEKSFEEEEEIIERPNINTNGPITNDSIRE